MRLEVCPYIHLRDAEWERNSYLLLLPADGRPIMWSSLASSSGSDTEASAMSRSVPRSTREPTTSRPQRRGSVTCAWQPRSKRLDGPECGGSRQPPPSAAFGLAVRLIRWKRHLGLLLVPFGRQGGLQPGRCRFPEGVAGVSVCRPTLDCGPRVQLDGRSTSQRAYGPPLLAGPSGNGSRPS